MTKRSLPSPSGVERAADSVLTEGAATLVAALSGNPLVALLPVLTNALASGRQKARVEATIEELTAELDAQRVLLRNITDAQYKLLNETILAIFQTTDPRKLEYLRAAVRNELAMTNLVPQEATFLSRIIRDISADEAAFVVENFSHREIQIADIDLSDQPSRLVISPASKEGLIASGLVALGLLVSEAITWNGSNILRFSDIVAKLIVLLRK